MSTDLIAVTVENVETGAWRRVVVRETMTLYNMHRVIQKCFKPRLGDAAIERMQDISFTYKHQRWTKMTDLNTGQLGSLPLGPRQTGADGFVEGRAPLQYSAGGVRYAINRYRRGCGDASHYVPRCFASSAGADLDAINRKLLVARFDRLQSRNRQNRQLPRWFWYKGGPQLWPVYLDIMRSCRL